MITFEMIVVWCDSHSANALACKIVSYSRTKHIELDLYYVKEHIAAKLLSTSLVCIH